METLKSALLGTELLCVAVVKNDKCRANDLVYLNHSMALDFFVVLQVAVKTGKIEWVNWVILRSRLSGALVFSPPLGLMDAYWLALKERDCCVDEPEKRKIYQKLSEELFERVALLAKSYDCGSRRDPKDKDYPRIPLNPG